MRKVALVFDRSTFDEVSVDNDDALAVALPYFWVHKEDIAEWGNFITFREYSNVRNYLLLNTHDETEMLCATAQELGEGKKQSPLVCVKEK